MNWFAKIRLRVFAILLGGFLAAFALINIWAWPVLPVVGAAFLTVAAVVNTVTSRLSNPVCWACGVDLSEIPTGEYGAVCPDCGSVNQQIHNA